MDTKWKNGHEGIAEQPNNEQRNIEQTNIEPSNNEQPKTNQISQNDDNQKTDSHRREDQSGNEDAHPMVTESAVEERKMMNGTSPGEESGLKNKKDKKDKKDKKKLWERNGFRDKEKPWEASASAEKNPATEKDQGGSMVLPQLLTWIGFMALAGSGAVMMWLSSTLNLFGMQDEIFQILQWVMLGGVPLMLGGLVYLTVTARRAGEGSSRWQMTFDQLPNDVHTLLVALAAGLSLGVGVIGGRSMYAYDPTRPDFFSLVAMLVVLGIDGIIGLNYYHTMIRQLKNRSLMKNTLIARVLSYLMHLLGAPVRILNESIRTLFHNGTVGPATMLLFLAYGLLNGLIAAVFVASGSGGAGLFFMAVFNALVLAGMARPINAYATLCRAAHHISRGEIDYPLNPVGMPIPINGLAEDMSRIQEGLRKAVAEAVKGERMKADLITNVSHDLKTPLTAIISYVDLLQKEGPGSENAAGYLQVLEEKTGRLKRLIEDLVEASKASSGNVKVSLKPVDLNEVLVQAAGEFEDRMAEAGLELRLQPAASPVWVMGDGTCLWRMLDNLLSNALKYSLKGTRVYAGVELTEQPDRQENHENQENQEYHENQESQSTPGGSGGQVNLKGQGLLVVKNVSAQALNMDPRELTERFVRGDEARTTEGSGLGLAIARGLAEAQQGRLTLSIDGDLFKAQVALPQVMPPSSMGKSSHSANKPASIG